MTSRCAPSRLFVGSITLLLVLCTFASASAQPVKRRAFVTSVQGQGNLSMWPDAGGKTGLEAGDAICRNRAAAASLPNPQAYRAWLSTSTTDAYCHVRGQTGLKGSCVGPAAPAGPWYLSNGITAFTGDVDELTGYDAKIYRPVVLNEFGQEPSFEDGEYWTGTFANGTHAAPCNGWQSASSSDSGVLGSNKGSAVEWTYAFYANCTGTFHLLCLETGESIQPTLPRWSPGAIVFVTSKVGTGDLHYWPDANSKFGVAAGDEICRNLAAAAHLPAPDSFVAWLSSGTSHAVDRITVKGPFRRLDSFIVSHSKIGLVDGATDNSIHVDEMGHHIDQFVRVWTGTNAAGQATGSDCNEWDSESPDEGATRGGAGFSRFEGWTDFAASWSCQVDSRLYCVSNAVTLSWDGFESGDMSAWSSKVN